MKPDFSGYASRSNVRCSDGRTIRSHAFKHQDQARVPLVWQHQHNSTANVLGHAILENREDGVYTYGFFNNSESAKEAKEMLRNRDINALSIYANKLVQKDGEVHHGHIREVSLVLSGANPGAFIDNVSIQHSDGETEVLDDEVVIYSGDHLEHQSEQTIEEKEESVVTETSSKEQTVQDIIDGMTKEQKDVLYYLVGQALKDDEESAEHDDFDDYDEDETLIHDEEGNYMTRNVFEQQGRNSAPQSTLTHSQIEEIVSDAQRCGSFKEAFLAHADAYGIENIEFLFPDAKTLTNTPEFVGRRTEWVANVLGKVNATPFARVKTIHADITHDEARARGYIKGNLKKEEYFKLSQRVTTPKTIYKKQKVDRDDVVDITDLDVVAWIKGEMRLMLDEEVARAFLIGDGREVDNPDKIDEDHIRPIYKDDDFFAPKITVPEDASPEVLVEEVLKAMDDYRGSGSPVFYTTRSTLTKMLLAKDKLNRRLYDTKTALANAMGVADIIDVDPMSEVEDLFGIVVNLKDYTVGSNKGGKTGFFDDFDIDYNQYKYLLETRLSGALSKFRSAVVILKGEASGEPGDEGTGDPIGE